MSPPFQPVYSSILGTGVLDFPNPDKLRKRPKGLEKLVRYGGVPKNWPVDSSVSCGWPLYLYYIHLKNIGQYNSARDLWTIVGVIKGRWKQFVSHPNTPFLYKIQQDLFIDDFFRKCLKEISEFCFPKVFSDGPVYMLFTHLHALTGKAPYTHEQIIQDVDGWVGVNHPSGQPKSLSESFFKKRLDIIMQSWYHGEPFGHLNFRDFCNDPYRWGTSGGAKATVYLDSKYRTKWAWALAHMTNPDGSLKEGYDLYSDACSEYDDVAEVALKEEAQKTREIITTPMPSYLRQAYLLYRWGKPPLKSPVSSSAWVAHFETLNPRWYGCLDGERFDHSVPADIIIMIVDKLGDLDQDTREVADEEIKSLKKLSVRWKGYTWRWLAGILSGWRITSIVGSIVSEIAALFIIDQSGSVGSLDYGVLGDDIVLYGNSALTTEELVRLYREYGLKANPRKTTSGPVGEFLRKVVSSGGSWGYPALAMRSIVYANPWISSYAFDKEEELSNTWLTFISRLVPHQSDLSTLPINWDEHIKHDLTSQFGDGPWGSWLRTPTSAGGGGSVEFMGSDWVRLYHRQLDSANERKNIIPTLLGVIKSKVVFERIPTFEPINMRNVHNDASELRAMSTTGPYVMFKHESSVLPTLIQFALGEVSRSALSRILVNPLPRSVRGMDPPSIIQYLLAGSSEQSGYTSIQHSKESCSYSSSLSKYVTRAVSLSKRFNKPGILGPAVTLYYLQTYRLHQIPFGTW